MVLHQDGLENNEIGDMRKIKIVLTLLIKNSWKILMLSKEFVVVAVFCVPSVLLLLTDLTDR